MEGVPQEECGSGSEEGDMERRFLECGNWFKCPWHGQPFDTRPHVLLKCGSCHVARYCSKECQRVAWPEHKGMCLVLSSCFMENTNQRFTAEESASLLMRLQKEAQNVQNRMQEPPVWGRASGSAKKAEAKIIRKNKKDWDLLKTMAETQIKVCVENNLYSSNVDVDKLRVITKTIPKFVTKFSIVMKGRALRVGQWLCAQHESKGAISMEFESKAAIEHATRWLDRNKHTFEEAEGNTGGEMAAFDLGAHMMEQLFLVAEIKGLTQVRYLTLSEAKVEAIKRAKSPSGQFENLGVFPGITEKLVKDIEMYDEKRSVIVLVHLKMEVRGGEPFLCWFVN